MSKGRFIAAIIGLSCMLALPSHASATLDYQEINPGISVDPASKDFGPVTVGSSGFQTFTVTSTGTTDLVVNDVQLVNDSSNDFDIVSNTCSGIVQLDGCEIVVEFAPNSGDTPGRNAQLQIGTNAQTATKVVPLSGTAQQAVDTYDVDSIDFGDVPVGTTASKVITMTNTGDAPAEVEETRVDGPGSDEHAGWHFYTIDSDTCTPATSGKTHTIPVGQSCSYRLTFTPTERGRKDAYTAVSFEGARNEIAVTGNGTQPAGEFDAEIYDFGSATIGAVDDRPKRTFDLSSTGLDPLTVNSLTIDGPDPDAFKLADSGVCSAAIPVNEKCQVTVTFDPRTGGAGVRNAVLSAVTTGGAVEVALIGTATAPLTYKASIKVKGPKKGKAGKKAKFKVTVKNTGTGSISGAVLKYSARQGKSGKAILKKTAKMPTINRGYATSKMVAITLPENKLKRGIPVTLTFALVYKAKELAVEKIKFKQEFGPTQATKKN